MKKYQLHRSSTWRKRVDSLVRRTESSSRKYPIIQNTLAEIVKRPYYTREVLHLMSWAVRTSTHRSLDLRWLRRIREEMRRRMLCCKVLRKIPWNSLFFLSVEGKLKVLESVALNYINHILRPDGNLRWILGRLNWWSSLLSDWWDCWGYTEVMKSSSSSLRVRFGDGPGDVDEESVFRHQRIWKKDK